MNADPFSRDAFCPPLKDRVAQIDVPSNLFWKQIWSLKLHDDTMKLLCYYCVSCLSIVLLFAEALACRALWDWFVLSFENDLMVVKDLLWKIRAGNIDPLLTIFLDFQIIGDLQRKKANNEEIYHYHIMLLHIFFITIPQMRFELLSWTTQIFEPPSSTPLCQGHSSSHLKSTLRTPKSQRRDAWFINFEIWSFEFGNHQKSWNLNPLLASVGIILSTSNEISMSKSLS